MFAVEGWKLGPLVTQTLPKKKVKRKRDEKEEEPVEQPKIQKGEAKTNPFSLKPVEPSRAVPPKPRVSATTPIEKGKINQTANIAKRSKQDERTEKRKRRKADKEKRRHQRKLTIQNEAPEPQREEQAEPEASLPPKAEPGISKLTPLQQKMRAKLSGSQFRHINEKLYTTHSSEALSLFTEQPSLFHDYHEGFRHQVQSWPTNPIDVFISLLSNRKSRPLLVTDLGCGDATLAKHFKSHKNIKVRSFDLAKVNEFVEVCDMANVPLEDNSVDVAVFCLSLMGTNFLGFVREACRYAKLHGEIWIAEIKSRFLDPSFQSFVKRLSKMGLKLLDMDKENKMFVIMRFEKVSAVQDDTGLSEDKLLKACLYKKR